MWEFKLQGRYQILSSIYLFHTLSDKEKVFIAERCSTKDLKRNEVLYNKGEVTSEFYIISTGTLEIFLPLDASNRSELVIDVMRKGDTLGIVSIFEKMPHSFSARARGDVKLLVINEENLNQIMEKIPKFNLIITRVLSRRLKLVNSQNERKVVESIVISVYSKENEDLGSKYAVELAEYILNESSKKAIVLRINKTNKNPIKASSKLKNISYPSLSEILNELNKYIYSYNIIILDLPVHDFEITKKLLEESEYCHYLTYSVENPEKEFLKSYALSLPPGKSEFFKYTRISRISGPGEFNTLTKRIAREISEARLGLALGGGAAFGLAQIGVLKVLERENITIDMVSGTSIGSLIGAIWASGVSAKDIEKSTDEINSIFTMMKLMDFSIIPKKGLIPGNNIRKFLEKFLGKKTFQDMKVRLKVIACDINSRNEIVLQEGNVVESVMASTAIPGLFNPVVMGGKVLVDGGVVNPLPVSALSVEGINRIIAVNSMPSPDDVVLSNKVDQSVVDIFINSFYSLQFRLCKYSAQSSDVYLSPILPNSAWYEFYRAKEFVRYGEELCTASLKNIKKLIRR